MSGLPLILFDTGTHLTCPMAESEAHLKPCGALGAYLHGFRQTRPYFQAPNQGFFDLGDIAALLAHHHRRPGHRPQTAPAVPTGHRPTRPPRD